MHNRTEKLIWPIRGHFGWKKTLEIVPLSGYLTTNQRLYLKINLLEGPVFHWARCVVFASIKPWSVAHKYNNKDVYLQSNTSKRFASLTWSTQNFFRQIGSCFKRRRLRVTCPQLCRSLASRLWETLGRHRWAGSSGDGAWCWRNCKNYTRLIQQVDSKRVIEIKGLSQVVRHNGWFYFACCKL